MSGLEGFLPALGAQAPAVAGFETGKTNFRYRRRQIVATRFGESRKASVITTQTVWLPTSSGPVLQQPSR